MSFVENWHSKVTIILFILFLFLPLVCLDSRGISVTEKRRLSPFPEITWNKESIVNFPKKFDSFFTDHFGFREELTTIHTKLSRLLKMTSSKYVVIGKEGWLFFKETVKDFRGETPFSQEDLRRWKIALEARYYWLKSKGVRYLFVIAPDKKSIYGEYLPSQKPGTSRLDQLLEYLDGSPVPILDLRGALRKAKKQGYLYFKTDTHWNERGAAVAQYEILKRLKQNFPSLTAKKFHPDDFKIVPRPIVSDLESMLYGKLGEIETQPVLKRHLRNLRLTAYSGVSFTKTVASQPDREAGFFTKISEKNAPRACIFRDSFFVALVPYISHQFSKSLFLWTQPDFDTLENFITSEPFDVVIEERVERDLHYIPKIPMSEHRAFKRMPNK